MSLNTNLIQSSFSEVKPIANEAISFFYKTLFETYPESKGLFSKVNLEQQKRALISSLFHIVDNLGNPAIVVPYLKKLGARHVQYGTEEEHYAMVGKSLIATFRHFFSSNWTNELEDQWIQAIGLIADHMIAGANESQKAPQKLLAGPSAVLKDDVPDLSLMVRQLAKNLLFQAIEQEANGEFLKMAKKKASNVLAQALREEADSIQEQFNNKKKVS